VEPYNKVVRDTFAYRSYYSYSRTDIPGQTFEVDRTAGVLDNTLYTFGYKNPNWKRQVLLRQEAGTPYVVRKQRMSRKGAALAHCQCHQDYFGTRDFTTDLTGTWMPATLPADPASLPHSVEENTALIRFWKDVDRAKRELRFGETIGEIGKTIRMFKRPFAKTLKGLLNLERRYRKKFGTRHGGSLEGRESFIRDTYLEWNFGMRPVFSEMDALYTTLFNKKCVDRVTVKGKGKSESGNTTFPSPEGVNGLLIHVQNTRERRVLVRYKACLILEQINPHLVPLRSIGLSLDQFIPTLWELFPYSFLVDYFTNVGGLIQAYSNYDSQFSFKARTVVKTDLSQSNLIGVSKQYDDPYTTYSELSYTPGSSLVEAKYIERGQPDYIRLPGFRVHLPNYASDWLNILALTGKIRAFNRSIFS